MPTIIQVAARAGVSTATVSRVLSHPDRVAQSTRERVLEVVAALGYRPNVAARSLRTLRAAKILLTVPDISNPFFANIIRGAEEAARSAGYSIVLGDTRHDPALENLYAGMLRRKEVDGLVFLGHRLPDVLAALIADTGGLAPVVNGCAYSATLGVSSVQIDNSAAAFDAAEHLIGLGHSRIGVITGPLVSPISRDRLAGVERAISTLAPTTALWIRHGDFSVESGFGEAQHLVAARAGAIFCFSDEMAFGALHAVRLGGLSCPEDVSVMGFDDIRFSRHTTPALTTIGQPASEIGRQTIALLLQHLAGELVRPLNITLPHHLVVRESTGPSRRDL